jgi:hypothetical protein
LRRSLCDLVLADPRPKRISPASRRPISQQAVEADSRLDDILVSSSRADMDHRRQSGVVAPDEVDSSSQSVPPDESTRESLTTAGSEPSAFSSSFGSVRVSSEQRELRIRPHVSSSHGRAHRWWARSELQSFGGGLDLLGRYDERRCQGRILDNRNRLVRDGGRI